MGPFLAGMVIDKMVTMQDIHPQFREITIQALKDFVLSGRITAAEFEELTGLIYVA